MPTVDPMPPGEVRRRGDRIRRRNNALATVGGLAVIAAIATPLAVLADHHSSSQEPPVAPSPSPSVTWVHDVPTDFPLTAGMPSSTKERAGYEQQAVDVCSGEGWTTDGTTDVRQATYTGENEGGSDRTVALYKSGSDADVALQALEANVRACADQTAGAKQRWVELAPSDVGERSLAWANHMSEAGDMFVLQAVRVGNAVLLDSTYAFGGGDPQVVLQTADLLTRQSANTVASMCVFSASPCDAPPAAGEGAVSSIPQDFPLERGLTSPEGDPLIGPSATADGVPPVELCGSTTWPAQGVDRLAVSATGPAYLETRELVTFSTTADVTAALNGIRGAAQACSDATVQDAGPAGADDAVTFAVLPDKGLGGAIYQFVQVGRAVYATYQSGEWSAETVPAGVAALTTRTEQVLPELCTWTEQGC